jgi:hypothetical protein
VKKIDETTVSMHVDEYRFFITRVKMLEAETESLNRVLKLERASFDEVANAVRVADAARLKEREAFADRIAALEALVRRYKSSQWILGVIGGGGVTAGGELEGFVGLGWKLSPW